MTVIFGVNLSDRVYLAGDSRISDLITDANGQERVVPKSDNILKVDLVRGDGGVAVVCAGDAKFAGYLLNKLYAQEFSQQGITSIRNNVEAWARSAAHEYFTQNSYTVANFIFAGSDTSRKKKVAANRILTLARSYLQEGMQGSMKHHLAEALERHADEHGDRATSGETELSISDTVLFALKISAQGVQIEDTVFGQFLLYGPAGLVKEDLEERYVGELEYAPEHADIRQNIALIVGLIHELTESRQLDSVGGCVIPICAFHDGSAYFIDGEVKRLDRSTGQVETVNAYFRRGGDFYRVDENGSWHKMIRVADYNRGSEGQLFI